MKKQAGITLLEVVIALGIMSVMVAGTAALIERSNADTRAAVAAQQMRTVGDAATAYIKDNYVAVMANATTTQPALIRVSDLVAGGYLTTGATTTNAYQQNQCVLVLEPTPNNLTALVVTEAGTTIDDITLGGLASLIGAAGGGIYSLATTKVRGAMGGWEFVTGNYANANHLAQHCDGTAGVVALAAGHPAMALWFANGNITSGFLYRTAVPGHPELNQMDTPILMGAGTVQISGGGCVAADLGKLARDVGGKVLMCDGANWKTQGSAYWQDPVANFASLPACNAGASWQTRVVQTPTTGTGPRAYVCNGASWAALAVSDNGDMAIPGRIMGSGSNSTYGGLTLQGSKNGWSGINFKDSAGSSAGTLMMSPSYSGFYNAADNNWRWYTDDSGNTLQAGTATMANAAITGTATVGAGCSPNGKVAQDGTGLLLSCQSGVWSGQGLGVGQTWQNIMASRALGVVYTNTTLKPIMILVGIYMTSGLGGGAILIDGHFAGAWQVVAGGQTEHGQLSGIIPVGSSYVVYKTNGAGDLDAWIELR